MKRILLILAVALICYSASAGTTKKPFTLAWDPVPYEIKYYTVYAYRIATNDYLAVATVLYPAPAQWTIPKGTLRGTIYAVSATTTTDMETERSVDVVLKRQ